MTGILSHMKHGVILFDFDGVIADSRELSRWCVSVLKGGEISDEECRRLLDGNAPEAMFESQPTKDPSTCKRAKLCFSYYRRKTLHCSLYTGFHQLM